MYMLSVISLSRDMSRYSFIWNDISFHFDIIDIVIRMLFWFGNHEMWVEKFGEGKNSMLVITNRNES